MQKRKRIVPQSIRERGDPRMGNKPLPRNVAIFVDMENLFGGYKNDVTSVPIGAVVREIEELTQSLEVGGLTASARAYANWGISEMRAYRRELLENAVEPVQIFSFNQDVKNAADIEIVVDVLGVATEAPWVEVFVIVSGDGGYVPLIRRLHMLGKYVIVVTTSLKKSGGVSKHLRSVADYYHLIQVPEKAETGYQMVKETTESTASVQPVSSEASSTTESDSSPSTESPTLDAYLKSARRLVDEDPSLFIDGTVNGARLGVLLREAWPQTHYTDFGYRNLAALVEEGCGMEIYRPHLTSKSHDQEVPVMSDTTMDRSSYVTAARDIISGMFRKKRHQAPGGDCVIAAREASSAFHDARLAEHWKRLGYPDFTTFLRHATSSTDVWVVEKKGKICLTDSSIGDWAVQSHIYDDELDDADLVRAVLGAVEPKITYPAPLVLSGVLQALQGMRRPMDAADLMEFLGEQLSEFSAEDIRLSLNLLWEVGALPVDPDTGKLDLSRISVAEGEEAVWRDAIRRAEAVSWPVSHESLEFIVY